MSLPRAASSVLGLALVGLALACGGSAAGPTEGTAENKIVVPSSGLEVEASILSVSLGSSYASVQLAFVASAGSEAAAVQVQSVSLEDAATGAALETLTTSEPSVWNGTSYEDWNERVTPGGDLKASYVLSAPKSQAGRAYSKPFRVRMTLLIGGEPIVIVSDEVQREPEAVT